MIQVIKIKTIIFYKKHPFLLGLFALSILTLFNRLLHVFYHSYNIAGLEDYIVYLTLKTESFFIYKNPEAFPFEVNQYTPIYFYITKALAHLFKVFDISETRAIYLTGRTLSLACNICSAYIVFKLIHTLVKNKYQAFIASLLVFNLFVAHHYSARPDSLKTFFIILAFYYLYQFIKTKLRKNLIFLILFSTLSILSKQDAFIFIMAYSIILFFYSNIKHAFTYIFFTSTISFLFLFSSASLNFNILYQNIIIGINQGANMEWFIIYIAQSNFVLLSTIGLIIISLYLSGIKRWRISIPILFTSILTFLSLFKWGSDVNYLIELQIILFGLSYYLSTRDNKLFAKKLILFFALAIIFSNLYHRKVGTLNHWDLNQAHIEFIAQEKMAKDIERAISTNHIDNFIVFNNRLNIYNYKHSIYGTLVNEYPEYFIKNLIDFVKVVPNKTYNYAYNFGDHKNIVLISKEMEVLNHQKYLESIVQNNLSFEFITQIGDYYIHKISCCR